jgi:hypothetical protein
MKTQLELQDAALELAKTLQGEKSARKISEAINSTFVTFGLDDEDYQPFVNAVMASKQQRENFSNQPLVTERKKQQAEAGKPKTN